MTQKQTTERHQDYFEGILQLRHATPDAIVFARQKVMQHPQVHITKEKVVRGGVDLYLTSKTFLKTLAVAIQKQFGGTLSMSPTLYSRDRQTSKDIYRLTVLLKLPLFQVGDVLAAEEKVIRITHLGKLIHGVDLQSNKNVSLDYAAEVVLLTKHPTPITKVKPRLEALDPETYQSEPLRNPVEKKPGEKVTVVKWHGLWLV
ncbi:hypothetical protein HYW21_06115 [Candidatus Woesearchaeota archaeon]|nr:hypothetical protein [Candidatus Woesearchaeota archaeon]